MQRVLSILPALALPCLSGCISVVADAQAGFVSSTRFEKQRIGGAAQVAGGFNIGSDTDAEHFGPGLDARAKVTRDIQQVGVGPHLYWLSSSWVSPYARLGTTLVELGRVDDAFSVGALGPRAELGFFHSGFVVSTYAEWDLRWTEQRNEGFVGLNIGVGHALSSAFVH